MVPAMSEEQLKAAEAEVTEQDGGIEEISEGDLQGVAGGITLDSTEPSINDGTSKTF